MAVGEESDTVETVAEPFLVREGLIVCTPRGRAATPAAWQHLGLTPPRPTGTGSTGTGSTGTGGTAAGAVQASLLPLDEGGRFGR